MSCNTLLLTIASAFLIACSGPSFPKKNGAQSEHNKKVAVSYIEEVVNERNLDHLDSLFASEYLIHHMNGQTAQSILNGELVSFLEYLFKAFPDLHYTIYHVIAEEDLVALNLSAKGTHRNEFLGFEASGNKVAYKEMFFFRIVDGKITEGWSVVDIEGVREQLKRH